jgi:hypothetical protein
VPLSFTSRFGGARRRIAAAGTAAVIAAGFILTGSIAAHAALVTVDGTQPLDLVDGSRLLAVEHYSDRIYDVTSGTENTTVVVTSTRLVEHNKGATFDPTSGKVYFLTGSFMGCALNVFDPETSTQSLVVTLSANGTSPLTSCWGLTTLGGGTGLLAAGSTLYDINFTTGVLSSPREMPCPGTSIALDPSTGTLYSGTNGGQFYQVDVIEPEVTCTLITTFSDVVDAGTENLKGFTFDTDGTMYLVSRWAPQLFSVKVADLTAPISSYGSFRFYPGDSPIPLDSLVMIYTPLPSPPGDGGATEQLASTGFESHVAGYLGAFLLAAGVLVGITRVGRPAR